MHFFTVSLVLMACRNEEKHTIRLYVHTYYKSLDHQKVVLDFLSRFNKPVKMWSTVYYLSAFYLIVTFKIHTYNIYKIKKNHTVE